MGRISKKDSEIINILSKTKLFAGVSADVIEHIVTSIGYVKKFHKKEILIRAGDIQDVICVVLKGTVMVNRLSPEGSESIVHVLKERKTIGIEYVNNPSYRSIFDFIAQTDVEIYCIDQKYLTKKTYIGEDAVNQLLLNMVNLMSHENLRQHQKLYILSMGSIKNKLQAFLYYEYEKCGVREFDISFNRESLAAYLCVNRSALSREISSMEKKGLIATKGKHFEILDDSILKMDIKF